jgi:hypothetical protein
MINRQRAWRETPNLSNINGEWFHRAEVRLLVLTCHISLLFVVSVILYDGLWLRTHWKANALYFLRSPCSFASSASSSSHYDAVREYPSRVSVQMTGLCWLALYCSMESSICYFWLTRHQVFGVMTFITVMCGCKVGLGQHDYDLGGNDYSKIKRV